ncbi:hypothetical protein [Aeromicrobium wangtongii]|uniref:hypothetical protein n=1 Tax=Aeromicrobium wangtongii TaxID=2969247 RepID=UPI0020171A39|nr:hypothetical protein [Aeromicrobium wangtongii]MCL3819163.1 hypothetical protein [Aeromicrobium wangtongii]
MSFPDRLEAARPDGRPLRVARSLAAALVCVTAAALGHRFAGGPMPAGAVAAVLAGSGGVAWLLSARRVTPGQLLGLLVLCQVGVHLAGGSGEMTMGPGMIAGHLAATGVSVAVLAYGERFVWEMGRRLVRRVLPTRGRVVRAPHLRPVRAVVAPTSPHELWLACVRSRRGPPVGLV